MGSFIVSRSAASGGARPTVVPPSVVLLGWVGSTDRLTQKYSALAHSLGVAEVRRTTAATLDVFVTRSGLVTLARELLEGLRDGTPACVFLLSNGGAFVWSECLALLAADAAATTRRYGRVCVLGVVFDSAPVETSDSRKAAGVVSDLAARALMDARAPALLARAVGAAAWGAMYALGARSVRSAQLFPSLEKDPHPALYIYSNADTLTDAEHVAAHVAARRAAGADVRECRFSTSPHVGHYRAHPLEYAAALRAFFTAIGGGGGSTSGCTVTSRPQLPL